ncbi:MAG: crossover junction endodeoxyribonuclease RuvC [bacterium]|nr:crossover junction endodeoxyribonuclease RuvC [bacterium]
MIILGIDPGTAIVGYALIKKDARTGSASLIDSGAIRPETKDASLRLLEIHSALKKLMNIYRPDLISLEKIFFSKNIKTALGVAEARGVILLTAKLEKIKVCEYAPNEVKLAVTGYGKANKKQVKEMMKILLKEKELPTLDDVTDAMAIAFTALGASIQKMS